MDETLALDQFESNETRSISALAKSTPGSIPSMQITLTAYSQIAVLPGHGVPKDDCGEAVETHCNHCGESFWTYSSCMMRECPDCYKKWASKEGAKASYRLFSAALMLYAYPVRKVHCVCSFPDYGQTDNELREQTRKVLKNHGLTGGCIICHPFRQDEDSHYVPDGYLHTHSICIAPGDIKPGTENEPYGAIFKHIPDAEFRDYRGLRDREAGKRLIAYLLTHCGLVDGHHAVTWFGVTAYNNLSNAKLEEFDPEGWNDVTSPMGRVCPLCGSDDTEPCLQWDWHFGLIRVHKPPTQPPNSKLRHLWQEVMKNSHPDHMRPKPAWGI